MTSDLAEGGAGKGRMADSAAHGVRHVNGCAKSRLMSILAQCTERKLGSNHCLNAPNGHTLCEYRGNCEQAPSRGCVGHFRKGPMSFVPAGCGLDHSGRVVLCRRGPRRFTLEYDRCAAPVAGPRGPLTLTVRTRAPGAALCPAATAAVFEEVDTGRTRIRSHDATASGFDGRPVRGRLHVAVRATRPLGCVRGFRRSCGRDAGGASDQAASSVESGGQRQRDVARSSRPRLRLLSSWRRSRSGTRRWPALLRQIRRRAR